MGTNSSLSSWWQAFLPCFFRYFPPLPFHVSNRFSSATCQKCLACRLGVVTGLGQQVSIHMIFYPRALTLVNLDLASHCRLLFHNRAKHTTFWRWFILYPLYVCSEIGIISTDLAELIGSAIALNLLFPKLPLWAGVLLTSFDVLLILAFADPHHSRPVRSFEFMIGISVRTHQPMLPSASHLRQVLAVLICLCILVSRVGVEWGEAFRGYLPSKALVQHGSLYTCTRFTDLSVWFSCDANASVYSCGNHRRDSYASRSLCWVRLGHTRPGFSETRGSP